MPSAVAEVYDPLDDMVFNISYRWKLCMQLFGEPNNAEFLMSFAPELFDGISGCMIDSVVVRLCHLTDRTVMGKFENLTIQRLLQALEKTTPSLPHQLNLQPDVDALAKLTGEGSNIREMRVRFLGHRDWTRRGDPIPSTNRKEIEDALATADKILRAVQSHFTRKSVSGTIVMLTSGGDVLVRALIKHDKLVKFLQEQDTVGIEGADAEPFETIKRIMWS
jgi:hypothetical protein